MWLRPFPSIEVTAGGGDSPPEEDAVGNQVAAEMLRAVAGVGPLAICVASLVDLPLMIGMW